MPQPAGALPAPLSAAAASAGLSYLTREVDVCELLRPPGRAHRPERLVLVLRGLSAAQAASRLPRSLGRMRQLHGGGAYTLASSERYSAVSVEGRRVLQALVLGSLGAGFPPSRGWRPTTART